MNSILQQLYMIPNFRKAMLEVHDSNSDSDKKENCLYQLKRIFCGLMELEKQYYNPKKFCHALKDFDGSPIDPRV
jgi:ubiquitin carboxyl-terminal hydrolase 9/24